MAKGKFFTTTEIEEIRGLVREGMSNSDIAELVGRSKKSITNVIYRFDMRNRHSKTDSVLEPVKLDVPVQPSAPIKEKTLFDFPLREIIKHMYNIGYRIENGCLVCMVKQKVNLNDIING